MLLPVPNPEVIYKAVEGGAVLLSTTDEVYYGLNEVGGQIWEHLPPVLRTFDELTTSLVARYPGVPLETIRADARALLDALLSSGLVRAAVADHTPQENDDARAVRQAPRAVSR